MSAEFGARGRVREEGRRTVHLLPRLEKVLGVAVRDEAEALALVSVLVADDLALDERGPLAKGLLEEVVADGRVEVADEEPEVLCAERWTGTASVGALGERWRDAERGGGTHSGPTRGGSGPPTPLRRPCAGRSSSPCPCCRRSRRPLLRASLLRRACLQGREASQCRCERREEGRRRRRGQDAQMDDCWAKLGS